MYFLPPRLHAGPCCSPADDAAALHDPPGAGKTLHSPRDLGSESQRLRLLLF